MVKYFGQNIAKEMEPVPEARRLLNGYKKHGIGMLSCITVGLGTIITTTVIEIRKDEGPNLDGTYDMNLPAGLPIGFGIIVTGFVVQLTKPIYLRAAVNEYNGFAKNQSIRINFILYVPPLDTIRRT